jgi:hypothetical protein
VFSANGAGGFTIDGLTITNPGYRNTVLFTFGSSSDESTVVGADLSGIQAGCTVAVVTSIQASIVFANCKTPETWAPMSGVPRTRGSCWFVNCNSADSPSSLLYRSYTGDIVSSPSIYRSGGATVEGIPTGWSITTQAYCGESSPFYTPWIYGTVASDGSKTFKVYTSHVNAGVTTAALKDNQIWLEVEYLKDSDEAQWFSVSDQRTITATATDQTADATSTWTGVAEDFKHVLSATAVIGETGQFRARVAVAVASVTSASYLYVDPAVYVDDVLAGSSGLLVPSIGMVGFSGGASPRFGDRTGGLR